MSQMNTNHTLEGDTGILVSNRVVLIRGLPGSGKSTLAKEYTMREGYVHLEADQFFVGKDGVYRFDPKLLGEAHANLFRRFLCELRLGNKVVVAGTFTQRWEVSPYILAASAFHQEAAVIEPSTGWKSSVFECWKRNTHEVPLLTVRAMAARWENKVE